MFSLKTRTYRSYWERNPHFKLDLIGRIWKNKVGSYRERWVYVRWLHCGNRFPNQVNPGTVGPILPGQNQGGQTSGFQPPKVTHTQATSSSPPLSSCRYVTVDGYWIRDCPTRFVRYSPYVPSQGNDHSLPATGAETAPRTNPTFVIRETEKRKNRLKSIIRFRYLMLELQSEHGAKNTRMSRYSAPTVRVVVQPSTFAWSSWMSTWLIR